MNISIKRSSSCTFRVQLKLDDDLQFAASCIAQDSRGMIKYRKQAVGLLRELKSRWRGVTSHLRRCHHITIQQVTLQRDVGLVSLFITFMSWPDITYPHGPIMGLPAVGFAPNYGVFPIQPAERISLREVLEGWQEHNATILAKLRPGKDDEFALTQSEKDASKHFCTEPMTMNQLQRAIRGQPYRLIPRHVISLQGSREEEANPRGRKTPTSWSCAPLSVQPNT